jgi:hypothetical protein
MRYLILLAFFIAFTGCSRISDKDKIIGIKIYEYSGDYNKLVSRWNSMGINTVFVSAELASDSAFRRVLKENNIAVFIIFPVFQDPAALQADSSLFAITNKGRQAKDDWVEFICPSRETFRKQKIEEMKSLVSGLDPDGLSIDFIRQFVFWEMIYPGTNSDSIERACFCDSCVERFTRNYDYHIPDSCVTTPQKADFLLARDAVTWNNFRTGLIASMVKELAQEAKRIRPGLKINVHVVPWRDGDFGGANINVAAQDLSMIAPYTDFLSPMCYSQMLKRDASWIADVVTAMDSRAPGKILPSIQVYPYYIDTPFTVKDFRNCVKAAMRPPSAGVVFWSWPLFEKDTARMSLP